MRWPSAIPAGTSTVSLRFPARRPRPRHSPQGCLAVRPSPWQVSQTTVRIIWPKGVRVTACSWPAPPQRAHVSIGVPGSAPLPWQCSQRSTAS